MPQFKNKEEYEAWKAQRIIVLRQAQDDNRTAQEGSGKASGNSKESIESPIQNDSGQAGMTNPATVTTAVSQKKCKQCAMMIPKEAKICPYCRKKQGLSVLEKTGLILISSFIVFGFIGYLISPPSQKIAPVESHGATEACLLSHEFVKLNLKAPATAQFTPCETREANGLFYVAGDVDAQNSFGALIRNSYAWHGKYNYSSKKWETEYFAMGGQVYIDNYK